MMPAQQRVEAEDFSANRRLRLIMQFQLTSFDRRLQVLLNGVAFPQPLIHFGLEETDCPSTIFFGSIKRGIGIGEQGRGDCPVAWIDGNSDADAALYRAKED